MTPADLTSLPLGTNSGSPGSAAAEPTFEECQAEWLRYTGDRTAGRVSLGGVPEGHHVAYYAGRLRDHDADPTALRARVAAALGVHPARLVVDYPFV
jgi:hypothetical protein